MSGLQRIVRHPDRRNDPHVRAHQLLSDELLEPIAPADAAWLVEHLDSCAACRATADAFAADAALLRELRAAGPPVPRDLGARVSMSLDDEVRRARPGSTGARRPAAGGWRAPGLAFAGLAAAAIVAIVVLPLAIPGAPPAASPGASASAPPLATPLAVDSEPVAWVRRAPDGTYVISTAEVSRVCPGVDATSCGTLDGSARTVVAFAVKPTSVLIPRDGSPAVVVGQDAVYVVAMSPERPVTTPAPGASPPPTTEPAPTPAATGEPTSPPVGSPSPSDVPASTQPATPVPATPTPPAATLASLEPGGSPPTPEPATPSPTPEAATPLPTLPPATPFPTTAAVAIAEGVILVGSPPAYSPDGQWVAFSARPADGTAGPDIYLWRVGEEQARPATSDHASVFSGWIDGLILASAARLEPERAGGSPAPASPAASPDGSLPPSAAPTPVTTPTPPLAPVPTPTAAPPAEAVAPGEPTDVAPAAPGTPGPDAAPGPDADPATVVARSYLVDPATGATTELARVGMWRPVVDPTDRVVVFWTGTLAWSEVDRAWMPAQGVLVAADWRAMVGEIAGPAGSPSPDETAVPGGSPLPGDTPVPTTPTPSPSEATPTPIATAEPGRTLAPGETPAPEASPDASATPWPLDPLLRPLPAEVAGTSVTEWEVRFDPAGRHLAVWVADPAMPGTGRLALMAVAADGSLGDAVLAGGAALPGFSLDVDRLAWSTPPGQNGVGSVVAVFAWRGDEAGQLYSLPEPGGEPVVVVR